MSSQIGIRPRARLDVVELATYIGKEDVTAGNRFLDSCEETFALLVKSPKLGGRLQSKLARLQSLRVFRVAGFPNHLVIYLERLNGIEIVRVIHGARDIEAALRSEVK